MANANHKSRPVVTERFVKIQESARHHSLSRVLRAIKAHRKLNTTYYPWIKLAGVWLEDAGSMNRGNALVHHINLNTESELER